MGPAGDDTLIGLIGVADNFGEPLPQINRQETILGLCISFTALAWLAVAFRLFARFRLIKSPGWDDLFVVWSLLTMTVCMISICVATDKGLGQHLLLLELDQAAGFLKSFYVCNASYAMATALIKISLLLQFMRLYQRGTSLYNACRALVVFVALWGIAFSFMAWVPCVPISRYWTLLHDKDISGRGCYGYASRQVLPFTATYETHAAVNVVLDLVVMGLPIPLYFEPGAPGRTRLGLVGVITMGIIVNIFSVWRFASTVEHKATTYPTFDPTWYGPITFVLAGLEIASACICASIPVFWGPLLVSASQLLGQIFVTKEIKITAEHRFNNFGSEEGFHNLEMQPHGVPVGMPMGMDYGAGEFGQSVTSRPEWAGKDGVQQHLKSLPR